MSSKAELGARHAREVKLAALQLRQSALSYLAVADLYQGAAFRVIIPTDRDAVAHLRELANLSLDICPEATLEGVS